MIHIRSVVSFGPDRKKPQQLSDGLIDTVIHLLVILTCFATMVKVEPLYFTHCEPFFILAIYKPLHIPSC